MPTSSTAHASRPDPALNLLHARRDRAERVLNGVRAVVLLLLATSALVYGPRLTPSLNFVNVLVLVPTLLWMLAQYLFFYGRRELPGWLSIANPLVDITAVTAIIGGYALAQSAALAIRSPIFLGYMVILAARPIASSTRKAAAIAVLAVVEYGALVTSFVLTGRLGIVASPVAAGGASGGVSLLDEGAKLLLLAITGTIVTYATRWHEQLAIGYSREAREREQLEAELARAQFETLKLQLHPHFLFNTLNSITALIPTDGTSAQRMVEGLSDLLRLTLRSAGDNEVALDRELDLLGHYLDIQQTRFQDRLTVALDIEPGTRQAMVPSLMLQPLVENAIRHGIAPRAAPGLVEIRAAKRDGMLHLEVADDGIGSQAGLSAGGGIGLGNTRARLQSLYGASHRFDARSGPGGGFAVTIDIPFHLEPRTDPVKERRA